MTSKLIRAHLRYINDVDGRLPPAEIVTHLAENVLRVAQRERWDLDDSLTNAERLRRMMFNGAGGQLVETARQSGMRFSAEDTDDMEVILSISDIGDQRRTADSPSLRPEHSEASFQGLPKAVPAGGIRS